MLLVRKLDNYSADNNGIVLTIGNFDGLHLGHQQILKQLLLEAKRRGLLSAVMCFEPQPLEFFNRSNTPARLSRFRDKFIGFKNLCIDILFCLNFNNRLASMPAEEFITEVLVKKINVKHLIVGDDFHFGANGKGDFAMLCTYGEKYGFKAESLDSFLHESNRISSTEIRELLRCDELEKVANLIGEPFFIRGKVSHGQELGRTIDFPTANINLKRRVAPVYGVYAVKVSLPDGSLWNGMANIGTRPTVNGLEPRLEVYILDFNGELYHQEIKVSFIKKMRVEKKFSSLVQLKEQITLDEANARMLLTHSGD